MINRRKFKKTAEALRKMPAQKERRLVPSVSRLEMVIGAKKVIYVAYGIL
jgi:hypothetical protein